MVNPLTWNISWTCPVPTDLLINHCYHIKTAPLKGKPFPSTATPTAAVIHMIARLILFWLQSKTISNSCKGLSLMMICSAH